MSVAVIPAGGAARRFWPWSKAIPKYMLLLGDRPLIQHALDEAAAGGFESAVIVAAPEHRRLLETYLDATEPALQITVIEQAEPRGTGDAVLLAAGVAGDEFGVLLPDDAVREAGHWAELRAAGGPALCFREVPESEIGRFGIGVLDEGVVARLVEKPAFGTVDSRWAVFGRYWSTAEVLEALSAARPDGGGELQLTEGFAALVPRVAAVVFEGEIFDCGTPAAAREAQARWYRRTPEGVAAEAAWRLPALIDRMRAAGALAPGPVEEAFRAHPRHLFLPDQPVENVYADAALPIKGGAGGRWLSSSSQPSMMALMLRQLDVAPGQRVLEIGAATGYNAALLAHLAGPGGRVATVEIESDLAARARSALAQAGVENARVIEGDGALGWPHGAPYDRVVVTCGATDLAPAWTAQLRDGGRLVVPLMLVPAIAWSVAFEKRGDELRSSSAEPCGFIPMRGVLGGEPAVPEELSGPLQEHLKAGASLVATAVPDGQDPGLDGTTVRLRHATLSIE